MKERIWKVVLLLLGCAGMLVAGAAVSFTELTDKFVLDATAAAASTQYRASTSLTIKLSGTATEGVFTLMPSFYIPDGVTLTVDGSEVTGLTTVRLKGGLRGTGTVAFGAGITKLVIGAAPDLTNILGGKNAMPALESDVRFAEASGSVEIVEGVSLVRWPASSSYTIAEGTIVAAMGANLFNVDMLTLDQGWDVLLNVPTAFKKGCTIVVPTGRTVYFRGADIYPMADKSANHVQQWTGPSSGNRFEVDLDLQGGTFNSQAKTSDSSTLAGTIVGDITGNGTIKFVNACSLAFAGTMTFAGTVDLNSLAGKTCSFLMGEGSSMADVAIDLGASASTLKIAPAATLALKSVSATKAATLEIDSGSVNISTVSGPICWAGDGLNARAVVGTYDASMTLRPGVSLSLSSYDRSLPIALETAADSGNVWSFESRSPTIQPVEFVYTSLGAEAEIALAGKMEVVTSLPVSAVRIAKDADIRMVVPSGMKIVNEGGSLEQVPLWKVKATLWTDASVDASITLAKAAVVSQYGWSSDDGRIANFTEDQVMDWLDCRSYGTYRIRETKFDPTGKDLTTAYGNVYKLYPAWKDTDEFKSLSFTTSGTRTRIYLATGINKKCALPVKCVVMTFNGSLGGGKALMHAAGDDEVFKRVSNTSQAYPTAGGAVPLVYSNPSNLVFRKNGAVVDGTKTALDTGWQVLAFTTESGISIDALGPSFGADDGSNNGGQVYGEILFFSELPSENEILDMEKYLADKWQVSIAHAGATGASTLAVSGSGTVKLAGNASLATDDYYSGTVDLNGKRLSIGSVKLPFKAAQIPAKDRLLWVDPRLTGAVQYCDDPNKPDEVTMVYTRDNNGLLTADGSYYLVSPFKPGIENTNANRRVRYTSGWFDFRNAYTDDTRGNLMFMRKLPYAAMEQFSDPAEELNNVAAGFFSLDSSRNGGGSLMLSAANGGDKLLRARDTTATAPIWSLEPGSAVTIATWLNGDSVAMSDPFSGGRDVMSFNVNNEDSLLVKCFGYAKTGSQSYSNNEILGEWLLYSANVPVTDRERIEAYLSFKWKNVLMDGFSETRDLTVSGAGVIAVAQADALPVLGAAFTGSVELTEDRYAFTLPQAGAQAVDAVVLPDRTLALQANVTIDVNATGAKAGTYLLMSAQTLGSGTTFTLGTVTDPKGRTVRLFVQDNALHCTVQPNGLILLVK